MNDRRLAEGDHAVVLGLGLYGRAVAEALLSRGITVSVADDRPGMHAKGFVADRNLTFLEAPDRAELGELIEEADAFFPSPGIPEWHPAFELAERAQTPILSEFDLARWWDSRPIAAVTGTDGKTTVTLLAVAMLTESGIRAAAVGNTETPLIAAIDNPTVDAFVVEASSFRLAHTRRFSPQVAVWLNFGPDHLDVHTDLSTYELAKARIWSALPDSGVAVAYAEDPVVMRHAPRDRRVVTVGGPDGDARVDDGWLEIGGERLIEVDDLPRAFAHDVTNTLAAAVVAVEMGASVEGICRAIVSHELPPHRIQFVGTIDGVDYYNDSKATVPHAVVTAVRSFESVVLIAGGRNKGLDLHPLGALAGRLRGVVAIGEAADEVIDAFAGSSCFVVKASDMDEAVGLASDLALQGDAVLLSPGCASYDAYANYGARGDDFIRAVDELQKGSGR